MKYNKYILWKKLNKLYIYNIFHISKINNYSIKYIILYNIT